MRLKVLEKLHAVSLRRKGFSLGEIVGSLNTAGNPVSKSSVSTWVRNVDIAGKARARLLKKISLGQILAAEARRSHTKEIVRGYRNIALKEIAEIPITKTLSRLLCALIYMCEGRKNYFNGVTFTNSDPKLVSLFLKLFRDGYDVDEKKFRVCVHLHGYHKRDKQIAFWSKITKIPIRQFVKPYLKPNSGNRIRAGYQGCASVRYHSNDMVKRLLSASDAFLESVGLG